MVQSLQCCLWVKAVMVIMYISSLEYGTDRVIDDNWHDGDVFTLNIANSQLMTITKVYTSLIHI